MKRISLLLIAAGVFCQAFASQPNVTAYKEGNQPVADSIEKTTLTAGKNSEQAKDQDSSLSIRVGNRGLTILETLEGSKKIDFNKYESSPDSDQDQDKDYEDEKRYSGGRSFRGHWSGLEIGFNNYNYAQSMVLPQDISYMSLDEGKSINFNFNFSQLSIGFSNHIGLLTGFGLNWNNYRFTDGNSIMVGPEGIITEYLPDNSVPVKKSKFSTLYLNVPALLEFQIPAGYNGHLNVAAGFIGGLKLGAWTKMVFEDGEKSKVKGDYNLNLMRGGVTARIGYQNFMIYGTYYLTPWFHELKGPGGYNLEPFEIGLALTFND